MGGGLLPVWVPAIMCVVSMRRAGLVGLPATLGYLASMVEQRKSWGWYYAVYRGCGQAGAGKQNWHG